MGTERIKGSFRRVLDIINNLITGELLGKLSKYMGHVIVVAVCFLIIMVSGCFVESLRIRLEKIKDELAETRLIYTQKNLELVGLGRMSTVEKMLKENGSTVGRPEKPATLIEE